MPTFLITSHLTEQGRRNVKEVPKRVAASREAAKKFGVEIKQIYMTAGEAVLGHRRIGERRQCR